MKHDNEYRMNEINPAQVIQQRLALTLGFENYQYIMDNCRTVDVSEAPVFQKTFNAFYRIRRNESWRRIYYDLFQILKEDSQVNFEIILSELYRQTGNVEASFSSKMLATIDPNMPIWDQYVLSNLGLKAPRSSDPDRLKKTVDLYESIVQWYADFLQTDNAKQCIEKFDDILPDYRWMSKVKKIDFYLWSMRR